MPTYVAECLLYITFNVNHRVFSNYFTTIVYVVVGRSPVVSFHIGNTHSAAMVGGLQKYICSAADLFKLSGTVTQRYKYL